MLDFLSSVFEFEVDSEADCVHSGPLSFKLFELEEVNPTSKLVQNSGITFSFKVKSEQELKEIMSKYNFFLYRKANSHKVLEKLELVQSTMSKVLSITDIDQRLWRFEFVSNSDI